MAGAESFPCAVRPDTHGNDSGVHPQSQVAVQFTTGGDGCGNRRSCLLKQEVEATKNYQQQFDRYISTFRGIISYAAQVYGFYYEVNHLTENMGRLSHQIGETPVNAIAVALHRHRNDIYVDIINQSIGIVNTIRQVCIDTKMTEKQRIELVFSIRPQLQQMNRKLAMLTKLVRCTTMAQVWYNIEQRSLPHREGKAGIVEECLGAWRVNGRGVRPRR